MSRKSRHWMESSSSSMPRRMETAPKHGCWCAHRVPSLCCEFTPKLLPQNSCHRFCGTEAFVQTGSHSQMTLRKLTWIEFSSSPVNCRQGIPRFFRRRSSSCSFLRKATSDGNHRLSPRPGKQCSQDGKHAAATKKRFARSGSCPDALGGCAGDESLPLVWARLSPNVACGGPQHAAQLASLLPPATAHNILPA